ncbi:Hypothetical protein KK9_0727 [Borreliella garinii BgVir]|nr:Hypothetical protein KK9_0727 [Borreliella garinii BgVir]
MINIAFFCILYLIRLFLRIKVVFNA